MAKDNCDFPSCPPLPPPPKTITDCLSKWYHHSPICLRQNLGVVLSLITIAIYQTTSKLSDAK